MKYSAIVFDLDGTLLDTEAMVMDAAKRVFARLNLAVDDDFLSGMVGVDDKAVEKILNDRFPQADLDRLDAEWLEERRDMYSQGIALRPGVQDLLDQIAPLGLPLAVATSSYPDSASMKLTATGLSDLFSVVVTAADVENRKPAPDPYLLAARRMGVAPETTIAFEDSLPGVASAYAAGMTVVHVPDTVKTHSTSAHFTAKTILIGAQKAGLIL